MKKKINIYLNELKLKSYLIRTKNLKNNHGTEYWNHRINQMVDLYIKLLSKEYDSNNLKTKKTRVKNKLKDRIIKLSERTLIDTWTYNEFAKSILIMIKRILIKPQFSGYSYKDDFYSDSTYKILKYINNFDHTLVSKITKQPVNAFSYISQIIHNSIIFIINEHKKYNDVIYNECEKQRTILNLSKSSFISDDRKYENEKAVTNRYLKNESELQSEIEWVKEQELSFHKYEVHYTLSKPLYDLIRGTKSKFSLYKALQVELFKKCILVKFYWCDNMNDEFEAYDARIPDLDLNGKDLTPSDYPRILESIHNYIDKVQRVNKMRGVKESLVDIIYDYSIRHGYSVELIGTIISTDKKLKVLIQKDQNNE